MKGAPSLVARNTLITLLLVVASLLLALVLFIAGAVWRGRVTSGILDFRTRETIVSFAVAWIGHTADSER